MFKTILEPRISDINFGNHLDFAKLISLAQEARLQFLQKFGLSDIKIDENYALVVKEIKSEYNHEVKWRDKLEFTVNCEPEAAKIVFSIQVKNVDTGGLVADVVIKMALINKESKKPIKPNLFFEKIAI